MKSKFTTNAQNILHLNQCVHGHSDPGLSQPSSRPGTVATGLTRIQIGWRTVCLGLVIFMCYFRSDLC